ncbi:hypothetical protein [Shouchella shacheensis]|uniref:hypothetical protein n=1 Tax=Shouchella shacheensis TaxID=1649580 RepID=UPI00073FC2D9|nr:hypothetical protein [Shouchella shacheensis]
MKHNLTAYQLLAEIHALLKARFPKYAGDPYRLLVENVMEQNPKPLPIEVLDRLWHTVYMKHDLTNFVPLSPQNIDFLKKLVEDLKTHQTVGGK